MWGKYDIFSNYNISSMEDRIRKTLNNLTPSGKIFKGEIRTYTEVKLARKDESIMCNRLTKGYGMYDITSSFVRISIVFIKNNSYYTLYFWYSDVLSSIIWTGCKANDINMPEESDYQIFPLYRENFRTYRSEWGEEEYLIHAETKFNCFLCFLVFLIITKIEASYSKIFSELNCDAMVDGNKVSIIHGSNNKHYYFSFIKSDQMNERHDYILKDIFELLIPNKSFKIDLKRIIFI
jgi:hypothetical protein